MYLATEFVSDGAKKAKLRLGTPNAWKLWLNGKPLFLRRSTTAGWRSTSTAFRPNSSRDAT